MQLASWTTAKRAISVTRLNNTMGIVADGLIPMTIPILLKKAVPALA